MFKSNKNRNVLIHSNYNPLNSHGGIETVVKQLWKIFLDDGYTVTTLCGDAQSSTAVQNGIKFVNRKVICKLSGAPLLSLGNLFLTFYGIRAKLVIFQEPYPYLWFSMFILNRIFKIPVIVLVHADPCANRLIKFLYQKIRKFVFSGAVCVTTSPQLASQVFEDTYRVCHVIPLGLPDIDYPYPTPAVSDLPSSYALYVGRLATYKGIDVLLESAELIPSIKLVIAGVGPMSQQVNEAVKNSTSNNIYFIDDFVSEDYKSELIFKSKFLLFPSSTKNEAFGLVQLEAMQRGKAIVNTFLDTGVNYVAPDMICAITVPHNDPASLAQAIETLWNNHELNSQLGSNGRKRYYELFSDVSFNQAWSSLIRNVLN